MLARLCRITRRRFYHRRHLPLLCLVLLLLSLAVTPGRAQDAEAPLPNGELIFEATFSKNLDGLAAVYGPKWMDARSDDGALRLAALAADGFVVAAVDDLTFGDLAAEVDVFPTTSLSGQDFGIVLRGQNQEAGLDKFYLMAVEPSDTEVHFDLWTDEGDWEYLHTEPLPTDLWLSDAFNTLRVEVVGDSFRAFLNGVLVLGANDPTLAAPGVLGLITSAPIDMADGDEAVARYDNLRVYALAALPPSTKSEREPTAKGDKGVTTDLTSAEVTLYDDFADPASGWSTGESASGDVFYADGALHLTNLQAATVRTTSLRGLSLADVTVTYNSRWVDGDPDNWHTVLCRVAGGDGVSASFSADGYYSAGIYVDGARVRELVEPTPTDAVVQGIDAVNRVKLACIGNQIRFWVNETLLVDATDDRLTAGDIGLAASALGGDFTEITFDDMSLTGVAAETAAGAADEDAPLEAAPAAADLPAEPAQVTATVTASGLNVRSGAGSNFEQVDRVAAGDVLTVLARDTGCTWVQIMTPRTIGWVSAAYVSLNVDCMEFPLAEDAEPVAAAAPAVAATATTAAAPDLTAGPALITDFETFGAWRRGDESWGEFTQSGEKFVSGSRAGELTYDFPAAVPEGRNYVVFMRSLPIPGQPDALTLWVHGDGSGNFLNVWVRDAREQVWQFSFGQIEHNAWRQLTAPLDTSLGWPVQRISGSDALTYPLRLEALVLDYPTDEAAAGVIYVDDLETMEE